VYPAWTNDTCRAPGLFARQEEKDTSASEKAEQKMSVPEFFPALLVDLANYIGYDSSI
jgi:hypothetical protein